MTNSDDKLLTRIGNLLRQAEGTDNEHEAETFTQAAQRLATAASIDLEVARQAAANRDSAATPTLTQIHLGERGKRGLKTFAQLFVEIAKANDVQVDIAHNSTYVVAYGYSTDIRVVEALYASLVVQMAAAGDAYIKVGEWRNHSINRRVRRRSYGRMETVVERGPLSAVTARIQFHTAFAYTVGQRLAEAREAAINDSNSATEAAGTSTALVLKGKEVAVQDFYKRTSSARGTWNSGRANAYSDHAHRAGARAGSSATLSSSSETSLPAAHRKLGA